MARKRCSLSRKQAAALIGVSESLIGLYERGNHFVHNLHTPYDMAVVAIRL